MFVGVGIGVAFNRGGLSAAQILALAYVQRVESDGGYVEAVECLTNSINALL